MWEENSGEIIKMTNNLTVEDITKILVPYSIEDIVRWIQNNEPYKIVTDLYGTGHCGLETAPGFFAVNK